MIHFSNCLKTIVVFSYIFFLCTTSKAIYFPVPLTGFNADVVADIPGNAAGSTTADYDGVNYVYMSSTFNTAGPSYIPIGGVINSVVPTTPGLTFQLQSYTANNTLRLPGTSNGTLSFISPQSAQTVYILGSTGSGIGNATITVTFTDLTTQVFTGISFPDWYFGANYAILGMGRTNRVTNIIYNDAVNPRLYQAPLALLPSNYGKLIQGVTFANTGGVLNIMAISIDTPPTPCSGTPNAGVAVANITNPCPGATVSVNLTGSTFASGLAYQWLQGTNCTAPWVPISGVSNPSAITPNLNVTAVSGTTLGYRCRITCTTSGFSDTSTVTCVVVQPWTCTTPCYGVSAATDTIDQDILNVTMGTLNNTTDCLNSLMGSQGNATGSTNRYANFTGVGGVPSPTIFKGLPQSFSLTIGTCGGNVASTAKIYIDFNHNSLFTDAGEEVYSNPSIPSVLPSTTLTGSFTVPAAALVGCTKMRVIMMSSWIGTITPTGTYPFDETEDYTVNIIQPTAADPAITVINVPPGNCFTNNETVVATLCNYGSAAINLAANSVTVSLNVTGPSGLISYPVTVSTGLLAPYGASCVPVTFTGVDMFTGGPYTLNTSLTISGLTNGNTLNDSLTNPVFRYNYRPTGGPDYQLCQGSLIPFGQGLTVSGCGTQITDSVTIFFTLASSTNIPCIPSSILYTGACLLGTSTLPVLPPGSTLTSGVLKVTNLATTNGGWADETRFPLFKQNLPVTSSNILYPSVIGNTALTSANYTWNNDLTQAQISSVYTTGGGGGSPINIGYHSTWIGNATSNGLTLNAGSPTIVSLKIRYTYVPSSFEWYSAPVGGPVLYTYSPFDPIGVTGSGLPNSNTPGTTTFYASCVGSSNCRVPVNLVINPTPTVVQDTISFCEYAVGSNSAAFDLTTLSGPVSAFNPGVTVSYYGDQALFLPVTDPSNDTSSTNFIYSKVTYTATGCYSSDSVLLNVNATPQFTSSPLFGNACAPNSVDVASLINPFTTTAGADTLYYDDPACTIPFTNPHTIFIQDTVYMVLKTNTIPYCSDTAMAVIDIVPASNYIVNQDIVANFSNCGSVGCANIILGDGNTETLYTTTDCRKIATVTDLTNGISMGSTSICEDIDCSVQFLNGQPYVNRHYEITPAVNDSAEVCLYYLDQDFADYNAVAFSTSWPPITPTSNLCITQVDNGDVTTPGHTAISIPNTDITATYDPLTTVWKVCFKVDSFSYFYCHACNPLNTPLPVTITSFTGKRIEGRSDLKWLTSSERNASHFIVERSKDLKAFSAISPIIHTKAINGNSNTELAYSYSDMTPFNGHNYYRLQQVDIDQHISQSDVVDVYFGDENIVTLYPNPLNSELNIEINTQNATKAFVKISDATGRVVRVVEVSLAAGNNIHKVDMHDMSDGIYLISITNNKGLNYSQTIRKK